MITDCLFMLHDGNKKLATNILIAPTPERFWWGYKMSWSYARTKLIPITLGSTDNESQSTVEGKWNRVNLEIAFMCVFGSNLYIAAATTVNGWTPILAIHTL